MNRIEMYASSSHLRWGLHRVLATAHALATPLRPDNTVAWWSDLPAADPAAAQHHRTPLVDLAPLYASPIVRGWLDAAHRDLGLSPLEHDAVAAAFRRAILSGAAHKAHMGRDVYGTANKGLWDLAVAPFGAAIRDRFGPTLGIEAPTSEAPDHAVELLRTLVAFDTSPRGTGHDDAVAWLASRLRDLGFTLEVLSADEGRPLILAHRPARGLNGHVVLYGHYDVTSSGDPTRWTHPPDRLTLADGRLHGRGVGDNKGPLACRLHALAVLDQTPALTWILQGEEETGSRVAHAHFPRLLAHLSPTLWLEETGYHDHEDGTLRLLARTVGPQEESLPPDAAGRDLLRGLRALASRWAIASRVEHRGLNKAVVAGGCPFDQNLPEGGRYLAVGINDSGSRIHGRDESVPGWTFPLHVDQLDVVFRWAHRTAVSP